MFWLSFGGTEMGPGAGAVAEQSSTSAPSLQGAFDQRMKTWQRWQDAQSMLQKKREVEARLLWANKPDKLQQAKEEISEVGTRSGWGSLLSSGSEKPSFAPAAPLTQPVVAAKPLGERSGSFAGPGNSAFPLSAVGVSCDTVRKGL